MPKRTDIKSILIIGAGPIIIGQACEFDYSGAQACRALQQEGYRVILINSNPATIMTDPQLADATYIEPIHWRTVEQIIKKEKPDAILPTMGGQTALNCALDLQREGVLKKYNCEMIGASSKAIDKAEDRQLFREAMGKIGLQCAKSMIAHNLDEAFIALEKIGTPAIIRPSFTMGGSGGGIAYNRREFEEICRNGLDLSPTSELLIEESLLGWKEFEMEVVRDKKDNCVIICSIENLDPMGVHTGDSITVAPAQTLTDKEYQIMRQASIDVLREIGVQTGGSNVQFAVNPEDGRMIVIEMNPRVSRSSALASKATGFPIAKIAAKLAVGYTLDELDNDITGGATPCSFEPSIDYVVTKIPRFAFEKFSLANDRLTTQMKSVGEVMAIGRTFQESLQKAIRGLEIDKNGLDEIVWKNETQEEKITKCLNEIEQPRDCRLWYLAEAFRLGIDPKIIQENSGIDPWFLAQIQDLLKQEDSLRQISLNDLEAEHLRRLKRSGFSDARIAELINSKEASVRNKRHQFKIRPVYKRVDTCAAEFATPTAYMYSTYEEFDESNPSDKKKIIVLGGGPNRIGQGIEFDYCCVHAMFACRASGYETIMVNCNPETVSTDYDISDRLYFEPLSLEDVLEIIHIENPDGVIVQFGGQTPLKIANDLQKAGVNIIGTSPDSIDLAEDRERFQLLLRKLSLLQPDNRTIKKAHQAKEAAEEIGYPLVVRPSYVLGGRAMEIVYSEKELELYMETAVKVSNASPVLLDRFLDDAIELDVDAVSDGKNVVICSLMEHIEQAGIHSGDSACCLPPHNISPKVAEEIREQTVKLAKGLKVIGLMNVQFAVKGLDIYVLEVNPRASRTVPFVSKAVGRSYAQIAAQCMLGNSLPKQGIKKEIIPKYFTVKESVFPFAKFPGVDPLLGPEMRSTGEVMGIGKTFGMAFAKATAGASVNIYKKGRALLSVRRVDRKIAVTLARKLQQAGFDVVATPGTCRDLQEAGLKNIESVNKVFERRPNILDLLEDGDISFIVNTVEGVQSIQDSRDIRRFALRQKITMATTIHCGLAMVEAMQHNPFEQIISLQSIAQGEMPD
jgi:carbamoyl-phosphate synthase large subunit